MAGLLDRVLEMNNLEEAWNKVADNRGMAGVDQVSIRRFARHWEANLLRLREQVRGNSYKPSKLRRLAIPKPDGGQRLISVPIVADRVLQRALLNVLDDLFERRFLACSYGYRPRRGLVHAVAAILRYRERGLAWVLDADIDDCFGSLDHELLLGFIREQVDDPVVLRLIEGWLLVGRPNRGQAKGIALGSPISPLCCNIYLHRLDHALLSARWALVRYADDFVVCCRSQAQVEQAWGVVEQILADLRLALEPSKTRLASFEEGFDFLGVRFYRDTYSYLWKDKRIEVSGPVPDWLWSYGPRGYQ